MLVLKLYVSAVSSAGRNVERPKIPTPLRSSEGNSALDGLSAITQIRFNSVFWDIKVTSAKVDLLVTASVGRLQNDNSIMTTWRHNKTVPAVSSVVNDTSMEDETLLKH